MGSRPLAFILIQKNPSDTFWNITCTFQTRFRHLPDTRVREAYNKLGGGGCGALHNPASLRLNLASWNLKDFQSNWKSKMEPSFWTDFFWLLQVYKAHFSSKNNIINWTHQPPAHLTRILKPSLSKVCLSFSALLTDAKVLEVMFTLSHLRRNSACTTTWF